MNAAKRQYRILLRKDLAKTRRNLSVALVGMEQAWACNDVDRAVAHAHGVQNNVQAGVSICNALIVNEGNAADTRRWKFWKHLETVMGGLGCGI